ncbi:hypothetical protein NDU88_000875 [Pleurodeles waltl]|uniref:Uncharacterized protein n=1 Tax=Pleurodeles waltl TaxID=8319 RepID=A0AAV7LZE4_PLEWA|nr:hypothetical protein NDU88_000875 [Pleurodeles waltl]
MCALALEKPLSPLFFFSNNGDVDDDIVKVLDDLIGLVDGIVFTVHGVDADKAETKLTIDGIGSVDCVVFNMVVVVCELTITGVTGVAVDPITGVVEDHFDNGVLYFSIGVADDGL